MPITRKKSSAKITLPADTELVGIVFHAVPLGNYTIFPEYTKGLHAWFLDQVRQTNPELSAYLHDGESEKPFTISRLQGELLSDGKQLQLIENSNYQWYVSALSSRLVEWMTHWLQNLPQTIELRNAPLQIKSVEIAHPATTYAQLLESKSKNSLSLSYISPTSFRRKKHHFPLPLPFNIFHSYLRRWNDFSGLPVEQDAFLEWIDENVIIQRHQISTTRVPGGKRGLVTGFTGAVEFGLSKDALNQPEYVNLFKALGELAPYCGTGHKTTFGLGQTRLGWLIESEKIEVVSPQKLLTDRIAQITEILMSKQKRTGGERAIAVCEKRAVILARRETGESLQVIATDLEIPYETVKTYVKLTRKILANS
ncbi:CRISPR-associated endoribonuclease Cas6 [Rivularia sp. UHCC 0363]|uniref:CRISPR-associated endoribonuclease Cas6 n=1 Tax=Rivularia sp. UHCC 0363 TaxID=3110244 RepID=UPI002B205B26|nr:CRISPR-associated endoribonuclease Cas6 [Rivularia sp. UHCC 0363]MEA5593476.1 CRISPR-associated endoribonuclease Cas6 [Rivularia sp. UHCC 0363]